MWQEWSNAVTAVLFFNHRFQNLELLCCVFVCVRACVRVVRACGACVWCVRVVRMWCGCVAMQLCIANSLHFPCNLLPGCLLSQTRVIRCGNSIEYEKIWPGSDV